MRVPVAPSASSRARASRACDGRSPESRRIRAERETGRLHRTVDAAHRVVGVDQQGRPDTQRGDLRDEG